MRYLREKVTKVTLMLLAYASPVQAQSVASWVAEIGALSGAASVEGGAVVLGAERQVYRLGSDGAVQWKAALGDIGRAFPVVRPDGSLLAAAYDDRLHALSASGQPLWSARLDGDIFASPALLPDGSAAVATAGGSLYRVGANGEVLWRRSLGGPSYSSPAVSRDGRIYLGSQAGTVFAFDQGGQPLWTFQAGRSVFSSPALDAAGNVYFGSADRHIYSLTPQGQLRWKQPLSGFVNASPLVTARGQVVVGSFGGELNAYGLDGALAWSYPAGAAITAAATELWNGDLLVGDLSGVLHRVSAAGQGVSRQDLGERIDTPVTAADDGTWLVVADGQLRAYAGGWPQAAGPWSSFRGTPQGWGRALGDAEQAALLARRQQTAAPLELAQAQRELAAPVLAEAPLTPEAVGSVPGTPELPTPEPSLPEPGLVPTAPNPAVLAAAPASDLGAAVSQPRLVGGRVHLPLPALAAAYDLELSLSGPQGAGVQAELRQGESLWTVPALLVGGVPYSSIGLLGRQSGVRIGTSAQGLEVEWAGQTRFWPLDWVELYANPLPRP